jgi:hypothetical protein
MSFLSPMAWDTRVPCHVHCRFGVKYPALYADKATCKDADHFNCVQRAHQNSLENFPQVGQSFFRRSCSQWLSPPSSVDKTDRFCGCPV